MKQSKDIKRPKRIAFGTSIPQAPMLLLCSSNSNQPWNTTRPTLLLLPKLKTQNDVNQIHARILTTGLIRNPCFTTKLILTLSSSPQPSLVHFARNVFFTQIDCKKHDDPFLWNAIIKSYSHGSDPKQGLIVFSLMLENGVCLDNFSVSLVLKACARVGLVKEGMQVHGLLMKLGNGLDLFLQNCLVSLYLKCGCVEFARRVFDRMRQKDSVSYNSIIDGYVKLGKVELAREVFDCMPEGDRNLITWNSMVSGYVKFEGGIEVAWKLFEEMPERDLVSWNTMIDGCVKCARMEDARGLFDLMLEKDVITWANMIDGYAKLGRVDIARGYFDEMPRRDVVACNAMIAGYVQNGCCAEALDIFHDMLEESNLSPDDATLSIVLSAIARLGHLDEGVAIHRYIEENRFSLDGKLGVSLIDMYSKCGSIYKAVSVFEVIKQRKVDHWNAMIGGLAIHGLGELAFDLFMDMERLSIQPDDITFIGVLNACAHAGLVKEGLMCFEIMKRVHKMEPKLQHYGCMVDILGRAGHIVEAKKLIEEMPIEPNDVVWRSLLSACKSHDNFDIGELVAGHLIRLDSRNSNSYVLLSNIYAGFGMWDDVRRIRTMMKERKLKKIPGCSSIELDGIVHEFFVLDKSHDQVTEIYSMVDTLQAPYLEVTCRQ